jgi:glycosyltransferase involved in cell wall biosynthesis
MNAGGTEEDIKFSVVVPTYDREDSLARAIGSLLNVRTESNPYSFEVLIVDNNPSAPTRDLVEKYAAQAEFPIRYLPEPRRGVSYARNTGAAMAKGDCVAFLDDDCTVHPDWISNMMTAFVENDCDIVQGKVLLEFDYMHAPEWMDDADMANLALYDPGDEIMRAHTIMTGNTCIKKSVFRKYGFFDVRLGPGASGSAEDLEFFRRIRKEDLKILYVPDVIVYHCLLPENITKEALFKRYWSMGYSVILAGIDPRNKSTDIVRLCVKIVIRSIKSLLFGLLGNEAKKFKQQKRVALYKGKIKGIRSFPRDEVRSTTRNS